MRRPSSEESQRAKLAKSAKVTKLVKSTKLVESAKLVPADRFEKRRAHFRNGRNVLAKRNNTVEHTWSRHSYSPDLQTTYFGVRGFAFPQRGAHFRPVKRRVATASDSEFGEVDSTDFTFSAKLAKFAKLTSPAKRRFRLAGFRRTGCVLGRAGKPGEILW